jgi:hypothetical protein
MWESGGEKPAATRWVRSKQLKTDAGESGSGVPGSGVPGSGGGHGKGASTEGDTASEAAWDVYEMSDPVAVKIPTTFEAVMKEDKWLMRRDA